MEIQYIFNFEICFKFFQIPENSWKIPISVLDIQELLFRCRLSHKYSNFTIIKLLLAGVGVTLVLRITALFLIYLSFIVTIRFLKLGEATPEMFISLLLTEHTKSLLEWNCINFKHTGFLEYKNVRDVLKFNGTCKLFVLFKQKVTLLLDTICRLPNNLCVLYAEKKIEAKQSKKA